MKTKTLALISGLVGLIGGTILLLSNIFFVPFSALLGDFGLNLLGAVIKLAALGLGIASLAYYKDQMRFSVAAGVLLIVGSSNIAPIPFIGWIAGILLIIGGALFLASSSKFKCGAKQFLGCLSV